MALEGEVEVMWMDSGSVDATQGVGTMDIIPRKGMNKSSGDVFLVGILRKGKIGEGRDVMSAVSSVQCCDC